MSHAVRLGPLAITDLIELHGWVSKGAGQGAADVYLDRIESRIAALTDFPERGTRRDDLAPGIRTLAFERRLLIAYRVDATAVTILRVVSGVRDLGGIFSA